MATKYKYDESRYVGCLVWGIDGVRGIYPIEWMEPYTKLQFEDAQFRVPKEWEKLCRNCSAIIWNCLRKR